MFAWRDFLLIADELAVRVESEAALRTAISRTYYAAYHSASEFVREKNVLAGGHAHRSVWRALAQHPNPDYAGAGYIGGELKRMRTNADYRAEYEDELARDALLAPERARILIDLLSRLS